MNSFTYNSVLIISFLSSFFWLISFTDANEGRSSSLPIPRIVSLKTEPVYMRSGPGIRYPILWVYQRRQLPIEITDEFNTWRKVRDFEGTEGWIHQSMLSGNRTGIVYPEDTKIHKGSSLKSEVLAKIEKGVIVIIKKCPKKTEYCLITKNKVQGWIKRMQLWGVYEKELIN